MVMEVSSHALDLGRVSEIDFSAAVFTNLSQDHLDFHRNLDDYREAKLKLFRSLPVDSGRFAVINADDPQARSFIDAAPGDSVTYGINNPAAVRAVNIQITSRGSSFEVLYPEGSMSLRIRLAGKRFRGLRGVLKLLMRDRSSR